MNGIDFHNVSNIYWYPVDFKLVENQFNLKSTPIIFSNGLKFNLQNFLEECKDVKINKKTALFLTDLNKASNFLDDNVGYGETESLRTIISPIADIQSRILTAQTLSSQFYGVEPWDRLIPTDSLNFDSNNNFIFNFYDDDYVTVQFQKTGKFLTWLGGVGQGNLIVYPKIYPTISNQKFKYFLGEDNITLFQYNNFYNNIVLTDSNLMVNFALGTSAYGLSSMPDFFQGNLPLNSYIKLISYKKLKNNKNNLTDSFLVQYNTNPLIQKNSLEVLNDVKTMPYSQNYLAIIPYEYPVINGKKALYDVHIHGLKNYQTPEYNYAFYGKNSELIENQLGVRRDYDKIFTGTNQIDGLDSVFLGYHADTSKIEFPSDEETPFYYAPTTQRKKIQESGLIEDGALAGDTPYVSDKLFFKLEDYSQKTPDQPQPPFIKNLEKDITNNTWFCTWLYLSSNNEPVWLDRYYNSAYYTLNEVLTSKVYTYNNKLNPNETYVFDVPSQMYLEPGALYKYFHVGQKTRSGYLEYIDQIDNDPSYPLGSKFLHISSWSGSPLIDSSKYGNNGLVYFSKPENLKEDYIQLDGSNHVIFPAKNIILEQNKLTVGMWINVDDWNDVDGSQIFGNYFESGFGLLNESSLTTPIITLVNGNNNKYYNINYRFGNINSLAISFSANESENAFIQRLSDYSFWVIDKKKRTASKYNVEDQKILKKGQQSTEPTVDFSSQLNDVSQIEVDSQENIYVFDKNAKRYVVFNTFGEILDNQVLANNINRIEIDINDNVVGIFGTQSVIDNNNVVWQVLGGNLYKGINTLDLSNSQIFANIGFVQDITCDAENYLWVAHDQDTISKIDTENEKIVFSVRVGKFSAFPVDPCNPLNQKFRYIHLIRVPTDLNTDICFETKKTEDRLIIIDTNERMLYQIDKNGNLLTKLDLTILFGENEPKIYSSGDITGYTQIRKFKNIVKKVSWKLKIADLNKNESQLISLDYNLSALNESWHHFCLVFDALDGYVTSYLDSVPIQTINFEPKKYQLTYDFRTSLLLGIQTIKNTNLNDIVGIDDGYKFIGKIADLRMYAKALSKGTVEQLFYSSKYGTNDKNMIWNMIVGKRSFVEDIKSWFKMQLPGSKSKYYNINIHNLKVPDDVKLVIEDTIKKNLIKIAPAEAYLYKINWY